MKILLRTTIFMIILVGISQALMTYAVVPHDYQDLTYSQSQVEEIAYQERKEGIDMAYGLSFVNGLLFLGLGVLIAIDMTLFRREQS